MKTMKSGSKLVIVSGCNQSIQVEKDDDKAQINI